MRSAAGRHRRREPHPRRRSDGRPVSDRPGRAARTVGGGETVPVNNISRPFDDAYTRVRATERLRDTRGAHNG